MANTKLPLSSARVVLDVVDNYHLACEQTEAWMRCTTDPQAPENAEAWAITAHQHLRQLSVWGASRG